MIRPIRTEKDYEAAKLRVAELAESVDPGDLDELDVLYALAKQWEIQLPDRLRAPTPVEAIRFRMEQAQLKPRDLEPFIGSRARVSEVLGGRRSLTLDMIRALNRHLAIPVEALIGEGTASSAPRKAPSNAALAQLRSLAVLRHGETWYELIARAFGEQSPAAMLRKTSTDRTNAKTDISALEAWCAAVMVKAEEKLVQPYRSLSASDARRVARLSADSDGLARVEGLLADMGIVLIILPHLPGTYLDGAAMRRSDGTPVIALTLRHDRTDNFWFTLLHEFGHVVLHLGDAGTWIVIDDLEVAGKADPEREADEFAQEALIPAEYWNAANTPDLLPECVQQVAARAEVHPSIVIGRWQRTFSDYRRFAKLVSRGTVRTAFGLAR